MSHDQSSGTELQSGVSRCRIYYRSEAPRCWAACLALEHMQSAVGSACGTALTVTLKTLPCHCVIHFDLPNVCVCVNWQLMTVRQWVTVKSWTAELTLGLWLTYIIQRPITASEALQCTTVAMLWHVLVQQPMLSCRQRLRRHTARRHVSIAQWLTLRFLLSYIELNWA